MFLKFEKYSVNNPVLKQFIKFFWVINNTDTEINHKFLPMKNIDLIINLSSNAKCLTSDGEVKNMSSAYFIGILDEFKYKWVFPKGKLDIIGISFSSMGLYPFIKTPLVEFKNEIIDFELLNSDFSKIITDKLIHAASTEDKLILLEKALLDLLDLKYFVPARHVQAIIDFSSENECYSIEEFCNKNGISNRQFERIFNKYVGINPKTFVRINRFQNTINQILKGDFNVFSDLAFNNGYYDQMHFIHEFKNFTGATPSQFINQKTSLKEISYFS